MATFTFRGLIAPVLNAFNKDFSVVTEAIPKYAKFLADSGVPAVLVNGTTGEGPSLSVQERKTVTEAWSSAVKQVNQHLMVQIGGCPLPDVKELARHAEKIGVDSLLCLPELFFRPSTPQDLVDYLKVVSEAAPNTPLLYYHNPPMSGVNISMEQFLIRSVDQIPNFHGIKYTSNDLAEGYNALQAAKGRYAVFLGNNTLIEPGFGIGFDSVIASAVNVLPGHVVQILKAIQENKVTEARSIQEKLTKACKIISKYGPWIPAVKAAMNVLTPVNVGPARPPFKNLNENQQKELAAALKQNV